MTDAKQQPKALQLAECLDDGHCSLRNVLHPAATELRRLHTLNQELLASLSRLSFAAMCRDNTSGDLLAIFRRQQQPPRQPLSEIEIVELRQLTPGTLDVQFVKFARVIEAAHGIKE